MIFRIRKAFHHPKITFKYPSIPISTVGLKGYQKMDLHEDKMGRLE